MTQQWSVNDLTALPLYYAKISAASTGNNNLVAAVPGSSIVVMAYNFVAAAAVNAKFQSDGAGSAVDLTGLKDASANGGMCAPFSAGGWFATAQGKTLDVNLSGSQLIGGEVVYVLV